MMTNDIQELFDGSLTDERAAELFHGLSVSPERRTDFQRHIALQGALRADRLASNLTNDEDAAIWGAISGVGVAASGAGSGYTIGWVVKPLLFVLAGVVGYILGTTHLSTGSGDSGSAPATASAPAAPRLPLVAVVPVVVPPAQQSPALAANAGIRSNVSRNASDHRALNLADAADGTASSDNPAALTRRPAAATAPANSVFPNSVPANGASANDAAGNDAAARNGLNGSRTAAQNGLTDPATNLPDHNSSLGLGSGVQHLEQPDAQRKDTSQANEAGRIDARPLTPEEVTRALSSGNAQSPLGENGGRPLTPEEVTRALSSSNTQSPLDENQGHASALTSNGFEVGFGHLLGRFNRSSIPLGSNTTLSDPHIDVSYRFFGGSVGLGARLGFGNMLHQSMKPVSEGSSSVNTMVGEAKQIGVAEVYANYRLPISRGIAVNLEGTFGGSTMHTQAGGNVSLIGFVADRIGVHVGVGYSQYRYGVSLSSIDLSHDGDRVDDTYKSAFKGDFFELRWGVLFHL
ncbi:MAG: hypothetical protein JST22_08550 [Bacteroidetes bacterium]|nr:hypothetical protein [Bacteroidota bacterium]